MEESMPSIKIVVVGETSVGKTTLIQSLSNSNVKQIGPTQGCHIEIIKRCYNGTPVFIELWDIGGWSKFKNCRQVFYDSVDGIIFVYDLTSGRSHHQAWIDEVMQSRNHAKTGITQHKSVPTLIVGNKVDIVRQHEVDEEYGNTFCMSALHMQSSENLAYVLPKFDSFFKECYDVKFSIDLM